MSDPISPAKESLLSGASLSGADLPRADLSGPGPSGAARSGWVLANLGMAWVAFAQHQVRSLETAPVANDRLSYPSGLALQGWVISQDKPCPIVALDEHLQAKLEPTEGRYVVVLKALHRPIGLLVTHAELLDADDVGEPQALPEGMVSEGSAVTGLLDVDAQLVAAVLDPLLLISRLGDLPELVEPDDDEQAETESAAMMTGSFG